MRFPGRALSCIPHRKQRGCQIISDLIAQVRLNLESVELAARSCREMSDVDGQALYDRMQAMIQLLQSTQAFLVKAGQECAYALRWASEG
jgi:hypothetical protein